MAAVSPNNILIASLIFVNIFQVCLSTNSLYDETDAVVILEGDNIKKNIFNTKNAWLIEFYSSWCGHCVRFSPKWKMLADDVKDWQNVIKLAVMDCSIQSNFQTCHDFDIGGYPSFKFFNASTSTGIGEFYEGKRQIEDLRHGIINYIEQHSTKISRCPEFTVPSLEWIQSVFTSGNQPANNPLFLIFEDTSSYIGREVILDVQSYDDILVRRVSNEVQYEKIASQFGIKTYPSLCVLYSDNTFKILDFDGTRESYSSAIKNLVLPPKLGNIEVHGGALQQREMNEDVQGIAMGDINAESKNLLNVLRGDGRGIVVNAPQENKPNDEISEEKQTQFTATYLPVYMQDLESTLHYSFRNEIPLHSILQGDRLVALKNFVKILAKFYPGRPQVVSFLQELDYWLEEQGDEKVTSDDWLNFVNEEYDPIKTPDVYLPSRLKWVGCKGSSKIYRGYPCGLWTLFHALTVRAATTPKHYDMQEKLEVLPAMSGYIVQFFGCRECATNFGRMAATISASVKTPDDAVLWLWRSHNKANKRLKGDASEDPQHPKMQFPPKQLCPSCQEYSDLEWKEDQVLKFLKEYYHINNIRLDQLSRFNDKIPDSDTHQQPEDTNMSYNYRRGKREKFIGERLQSVKDSPVKIGFFGLGMNGMDMSMCVLLYGFCIGLVFLLYIIFCKRRKRKYQKHMV